jgi:hypothetical protein
MHKIEHEKLSGAHFRYIEPLRCWIDALIINAIGGWAEREIAHKRE